MLNEPEDASPYVSMHDISSNPNKPTTMERKALLSPLALRPRGDSNRGPYPRLTPLLREQAETGHHSEEVERLCMKYTKESQPNNET